MCHCNKEIPAQDCAKLFYFLGGGGFFTDVNSE